MLIYFIKFIHLLATLCLLGLTSYSVVLIASKHADLPKRTKSFKLLTQVALSSLVLAVMTGSFLIYPKGFTLHTPWIQAAYVLAGIFFVMTLALFFFHKRAKYKITVLLNISLIAILVIVVHDAVTKTTFLFSL